MKKIIAALVVLAIAAPAMAAVTVSAVDEGDGVVAIHYATTGDPVRAFGLDLTLTGCGDPNFVDVNGTTNADYPIFPGSVTIDMDGNVSDYGTPIGSVDDHPDTKAGLGTDGVTIEMGSLYASGDPAPASSGILLKLDVRANGQLGIAENAARGGVVMEDGSSPALTLLGCPVVITAPCVGDVDCNKIINKQDIGALVTLLVNNASAPFWMIPSTSGAYYPEADVDGNGTINKQDIGALVTYLVNNASAPFWMVPCP